MYSIFEDNINDCYVKLMLSKYTTEELSKMSFDGSNEGENGKNNAGPIDRAVKHLESNPNDIVCIFMDLPLDNYGVVKEYKRLYRLMYRDKLRILFIPFPCLEFYFIKAFVKTAHVKDVELAKCVLEFEDYRKTDLYSNSVINKPNGITWEQFCKLVLRIAFRDCFRYKTETKGPCFFLRDCNCSRCDTRDSLLNKASLIFRGLRCMPYGSLITEMKPCTLNDIYNLHVKLIDIYNAIVTTKYSSWSSTNGGDYLKYQVKPLPKPEL